MATVATGNPLGIWTVAYRASTPESALPDRGTPITGKVVRAATAPARCAAEAKATGELAGLAQAACRKKGLLAEP